MPSEPRPRSRTATALRVTWARLVAADPGRARLRVGVAAAVSLGVVLGIEYVYGTLTGSSITRTAMLLGAISAMQISGSIMHPTATQRLRMVAGLPIAAAFGLALSLVSRELAGNTVHMAAFVLMTFLAVIVRRFGPQFGVLGLIGWVAYFISTFLAPPLSALPFLIGAEILSAAAVFGLSLLLWGHRPATALRSALNARRSGIALLLLTASRLTAPEATRHTRVRLRRKLRSQSVRVSDTGVLIEGWLKRLGSTDDFHPAATRQRLFEGHIAIDTLVDASLDLAMHIDDVDNTTLTQVSAMLRSLARDHDGAAVAHARQFLPANESEPAPDDAVRDAVTRVATACLELTETRRRATTAPAGPLPQHDGRLTDATVTAATTTTMQLGPDRTSSAPRPRTTPLPQRTQHRISVPTRQAIQATIAMAITLPIGDVISPVHYLWALVAVFIVFLGPTTRGELAVKALHRTIGTVAGLIVAIPITLFTTDHTLRVIAVALIACFVGHYLMSISYSFLMFCITVGVLQMYELMGAFSLQLLMLRLGETILGAAIAAAVAYFIVPVRTKDTSAYLARGFFHAVAELLSDLAWQLEHKVPIDVSALSTAILAIDDQARRHRAAGSPYTWYPRRRGERTAINASVAALAIQVRQTAGWILSGRHTDDTAPALRALAAVAERLAHEEVTWNAPTTDDHDDHRHNNHPPMQRLYELLQHGQPAA